MLTPILQRETSLAYPYMSRSALLENARFSFGRWKQRWALSRTTIHIGCVAYGVT